MSDKVALVRLRAKNDQYDESMRKSRKATEDLAGSGDKVAKSSQQLTAVWKGLAVAGAGLFAKQAVDAASNLAEAQSKVNVVFGESSDVITKFADDSATAFGQSKAQALEATGTFGNLFRSIGLTEEQSAKFSTTMTGLASDLASFNNTSVDDALTALRSGLVGETEPLKRFGVNLNDATLKAKALELGLSDGKGVLDANAKAQAAYALIMEQTTLAQGDFARTSDGLANKQRIAAAEFENTKAELGQNLLPVMTAVTGASTELLSAFNALPGSMQSLLVGAVALAVVGPRISGAWDAVATSLRNVRTAATSTVSSVGYLKSAGLGLLAGVAGYNLTYEALERLNSTKVDTAGLADAVSHLGSAGTGLGDVFSALGGEKFNAKGLAADFQTVSDGLHGMAQASAFTEEMLDNLTEPLQWLTGNDFKGIADDFGAAKKRIHEFDTALADLASTDPAAAQRAFQQITMLLLDQGVAVDQILPLMPKYSSAIGTTAAKEAVAAAVTKKHNDELGKKKDRLEELLSLRLKSADADQAVNDAVIAVADAQQGVADALEGEKQAADGVTQANRDLADARRGVADAHEAVAAAQRGVADAMRGEQEAAKAVTSAIADQHQAEQDLADARRAATGDSDEMRDAIEGVADAEKALRESQEASLDAQTALDDARKNYGQTLQNLKDDAEGAADDVLQAEIALRKAKQALADLGKPDKDGKVQPVTADERLAAQIAVREAERRLRELEQRAAEAQDDYDRNAADVEQSDAVVEATNNVAAAKENEQTARENLAAAQDNVANVQQAAADRVAKAEQTLAEKVEAVQKAQQARIDAHQKVVDAQRNVQKAAEGVRDAEAQVAEKTDAVNTAQQRLNDAKDATVKARDEVKTAEDKVTTALLEKAKAHWQEETKTRGAERANRDYATSLAGILSLMDPNDPRYKAYMLYLAQLERLNAQGTAQQTVPPTRNPDRYSGQTRDSSGLRRRAGSGGRAESDLAGPTTDAGWTTTPTGEVLTPEIGLTPVQMPHPVVGPPRRGGFRQPIGGLIDGTNWHFGPGNTKLTPGNRPVALSPDTVRAITNAAGRSVTVAPRVDASDLNVAQAITLTNAITDDALFAAGVR